MFWHRTGYKNTVVDALSRRTHLLATLKNEIIGFVSLLDLYATDKDLGEIWRQCQ